MDATHRRHGKCSQCVRNKVMNTKVCKCCIDVLGLPYQMATPWWLERPSLRVVEAGSLKWTCWPSCAPSRRPWGGVFLCLFLPGCLLRSLACSCVASVITRPSVCVCAFLRLHTVFLWKYKLLRALEGSSGSRMTYFVLQGNWWNRSSESQVFSGIGFMFPILTSPHI